MADTIELPKPKTVLKMIFTHNQNIEVKTDRYTIEELKTIMTDCAFSDEPVHFWGSDENDQPVLVGLLQPNEMIGYIVLDFESFLKTMRGMQLAQARAPLVRQ